MPLGLFPDSEPGRLDLELRQGDVLFFYTDGVTEARSADLTFFEDRLSDALAAVAGRSAADIVHAVQELVTTFSAGELKDDVTILAVRVSTQWRLHRRSPRWTVAPEHLACGATTSLGHRRSCDRSS